MQRTFLVFVGIAALASARAGSASAQTGAGQAGSTGTSGTTWAPATGGQAAAQPAAAATTPPVAAPTEPGIAERTPAAWVSIQRGHRAFLARDFDTAVAAYREAAMSTPPPAVAHYFIGSAQRAKGQWTEAIESFRTAARLGGDADPALKAKALFGIAMTLDIQGQLAQAREAWLEYKTWVVTHGSIPGFPGTADGHVAAIDKVVSLDQQYAVVRQRIAEREAAAAANPPPAE